jgi:hypothetical protein
MDARKQRIIEAVGEENILDALKRMTEASRRVNDIIPKFPINEKLVEINELCKTITEPVFGSASPLRDFQRHLAGIFKSVSERLVTLGQQLEYIEQQRESAESDIEKTPVKLNTVSYSKSLKFTVPLKVI